MFKSDNAVHLLVLILMSGGCTTPEDLKDSGLGDCVPEPDAGDDQVVSLGARVTLDGSESIPCGNQNYVWSVAAVPPGSGVSDSSLSDNNSPACIHPEFTPDVIGSYVLSLSLPLGSGQEQMDLVIIDVVTDDMPPVAECSGPGTISLGERADFDGSASHDPEGNSLDYSWALSAVPDGSALSSGDIFNSSSVRASVIPDVAGLYMVSLVVSDGLQWSHEPAYCSLTVATDNEPPVANAGSGGTLPPCTDAVFELNGWASYDPEGAPIEYTWTLIGAPEGSTCDDSCISDPSAPNPTVRWDVSGSYTFQLFVHDGELQSAPDIVTYTIMDRADNTAPVANAGADQTISDDADCTTSAYVWTCDDCEASSVELDGGSSYDPDGDSIRFYWSDPSGELNIHTPQGSFTYVTTPAVSATVDTTTNHTWDVYLDASDCELTSSDSVQITYSCTGNR